MLILGPVYVQNNGIDIFPVYFCLLLIIIIFFKFFLIPGCNDCLYQSLNF